MGRRAVGHFRHRLGRALSTRGGRRRGSRRRGARPATAGLAVAGALFGAVAAAIALALALAVSEGPAAALDFEALGVAALLGAACGAVAAPAAGWLLLRRVPLGRAVAGTVGGTVVGGVAGWLLAPMAGTPVVGAVLGFFISAGLLRLQASRHPERSRRTDMDGV